MTLKILSHYRRCSTNLISTKLKISNENDIKIDYKSWCGRFVVEDDVSMCDSLQRRNF